MKTIKLRLRTIRYLEQLLLTEDLDGHKYCNILLCLMAEWRQLALCRLSSEDRQAITQQGEDIAC